VYEVHQTSARQQTLNAQTAREGEGAGVDVVEGANTLFAEAVGVVLLLLRPRNRNILSRLRVGGCDMTARAMSYALRSRFTASFHAFTTSCSCAVR
jgi:hypothetical protein